MRSPSGAPRAQMAAMAATAAPERTPPSLILLLPPPPLPPQTHTTTTHPSTPRPPDRVCGSIFLARFSSAWTQRGPMPGTAIFDARKPGVQCVDSSVG